MLVSILQLFIAISLLIVLHEIGHYTAARLVKIDSLEFGIGFPPRALRLWRGKGWVKIGSTKIVIPLGTKVMGDLEPGTWVEAAAKQAEDGSYRLENLQVITPTEDEQSTQKHVGENEVFRGAVQEIKPGMLFSLNWLPLGGFVHIKGEGDTSIPDGLAAANPWKRIFVYLGGPLANIIVAILLYAIIISQTGIAVGVSIEDVMPGSPAAAAGIQTGDQILAANGQELSNRYELYGIIYDNLGQPVEIVYQQGDQTHTVTLVPRDPPPEDGAIGILMGDVIEPVGMLRAIPLGAMQTVNQTLLILTIPGEIIKGAIAPEIARPVGYKGMYDMYEFVKDESIAVETPGGINLNIIDFFAMVSMSLAIFNLLPIPALDGGRILFTLPEIIFRRRIPMEWQNAVNFFSFVALILLFLYINVLDFTNPIPLP